MDEPTASRVVSTLMKRKLVQVKGDAADRRRACIHLRAPGAALGKELRALATTVRAAVVQGLSTKRASGAARRPPQDHRQHGPAAGQPHDGESGQRGRVNEFMVTNEQAPATVKPEIIALRDATAVEQTQAAGVHRVRHRARHRWWLWLLALVILAGGGYWLLTRAVQQPAAAAAPAAKAVRPERARGRRHRATGRHARLSDRARLGDRLQHRHREEPRRRPADQGRLSGGPVRSRRRSARRNRSAPVPGAADAGRGADWRATRRSSRTRSSTSSAIATCSPSELIAKQQVDDQAATVGQYEGAVKVDQGAIDNAKLQLTYCRITAPISGRVGLRLVDVGNMVHANDQNGLLVITQVQPIAVLFTIPEDNLPPS